MRGELNSAIEDKEEIRKIWLKLVPCIKSFPRSKNRPRPRCNSSQLKGAIEEKEKTQKELDKTSAMYGELARGAEKREIVRAGSSVLTLWKQTASRHIAVSRKGCFKIYR